MEKLHKPLITADEARRLYEVLCAIDSYPVKDGGSSVHKVYESVAELILLKAGISLGKKNDMLSLIQDVRRRLLKNYGVSYINAGCSGVWESVGVDEYDVRGALLLGSYLSRSGFDETFEKELEYARSYFSEASEIDEDFYTDFVDEYADYEDEQDRAFDLGANLAVDFIDAVLVCLKEGSEQIYDSCLYPFYEVACVLDGIYEDNLDLFMEHLPGLLIKVAEPYVCFDYAGNNDNDRICGCLGQCYYYIEEAAGILPYLKKDSSDQDVSILREVLEWFRGGLYTFSDYANALSYCVARDKDILVSVLCPEGETAAGMEPIPSLYERFAPLIWEALYPVVAEKYLKEDVNDEQAA